MRPVLSLLFLSCLLVGCSESAPPAPPPPPPPAIEKAKAVEAQLQQGKQRLDEAVDAQD